MTALHFPGYAIETPATPARRFAGVSRHSVTYLRFTDEAEQEAAFAAAGIVAPEGESLPPDFHWPDLGDISVIGLIYNDDAVIDSEGNIVTPPTAKPGWHVNILPA